jgi:hypothetical protein
VYELAVNRDLATLRRGAGRGPFAAGAHVHIEVREIVMIFAAPPFCGFGRIGERLEDAFSGRGDE